MVRCGLVVNRRVHTRTVRRLHCDRFVATIAWSCSPWRCRATTSYGRRRRWTLHRSRRPWGAARARGTTRTGAGITCCTTGTCGVVDVGVAGAVVASTVVVGAASIVVVRAEGDPAVVEAGTTPGDNCTYGDCDSHRGPTFKVTTSNRSQHTEHYDMIGKGLLSSGAPLPLTQVVGIATLFLQMCSASCTAAVAAGRGGRVAPV